MRGRRQSASVPAAHLPALLPWRMRRTAHAPPCGKMPCLSCSPPAPRERSSGAPARRRQGPGTLTLGSACAGAQAFARLSAVYGGTYMLNKPDAEVVWEDGAAVGVRSEGQTARAKLVVRGPPPPPWCGLCCDGTTVEHPVNSPGHVFP
jgi:hypothetical protein